MSGFQEDDLTSALRKLSIVGIKRENLPKQECDSLWDRLMCPPFNMNSDEACALKMSVLNPTSIQSVTTASPSTTELNEGSSMVTSLVHHEFVGMFGRLLCKDTAVWDRMHSLAVDSHDPLAQAALAVGYYLGYFSKDVERSTFFGRHCVAWLNAQNDEDSHFCLGVFHFYGISVALDKKEAARYWRLAAEAGSVLGQSDFGFYCKAEQNYVEAVKWYRLAADAGYCVAQNNLANMYCDGLGVTQDFEEAVKLYRLSAEEGYAVAQYAMGYRYLNGEGVEQDCSLAVYWFRLAADQGDAYAQTEVGVRYYTGEGVEKDLIEAVRWFRLAAAQDHSDAQSWMGSCHEFGLGVELNFAEMLRWYRLAVAQNEQYAQYFLGLCYENGKGLTKDINEAIRLYTLASEQGHQDATNRLDLLRA